MRRSSVFWRRWLTDLLAAGVCGVLALVAAIEFVPDAGPLLANTVRSWVGPLWVARAEEVYYDVRDRLDRATHGQRPPALMFEDVSADRGHTAIPHPTQGTPATPGPDVNGGMTNGFQPPVVTLPYPAVASHADGQWQDWGAAGNEGLIKRTQIHSDPARPQTVVAIIAMDLSRLALRLQPGKLEPASEGLAHFPDRGLVPLEARRGLVAAFNGGWQAVHGHLGMRLGPTELLPPVSWGCTIAAAPDGHLRIASWSALRADYATLAWMRQTPPCLVENGKENRHLEDEQKRWGSALSGATVIRRSALGLDASGRVLLYAVGDNTTSAAIARALRSAGAVSAAMLDINYQFPRYVVFGTGPHEVATGWRGHLPLDPVPPEDFYLGHRAEKDFFYLTRR